MSHAMMFPNNPRAVRSAVQPAKLRDDAVDPALDGGALCYVDEGGRVPDVEVLEMAGGAFEGGGGDVCDADCCAAAGDQFSGCEADSRGAASYGDYFVLHGYSR